MGGDPEMSVLIPGMKVPESCGNCRMLEGYVGDGLCHAANNWLDDESFLWPQYEDGDIDDSKPINCPLVELPEKHGRLVDADYYGNYLRWQGDEYSGLEIVEMIKDWDTVIEAEGSE